MKALTVRSPWAGLVVLGLKDVENRSRRTGFRGRLAIHQAKTRGSAADLERGRVLVGDADTWARCQQQMTHSPGCIVGTVELVDCLRDSDSAWALAGEWHWLLWEPHLLQPQPAPGRLKLWDWPTMGSAVPSRRRPVP